MEFMKQVFGPDTVKLVDKVQTSNADVDAKIQSLKSRGLPPGEIEGHLKEVEGIEVSRRQVHQAMDQLIPDMQEWLNRPLERLYPIVFLDGMRVAVRDNGRTIKKCSYHMIGVNEDGQKELLGIWVADTEGAKFWSQVLTEVKNRGVEDILIACVDGLTGFPEAIEGVFPQTRVQLCINHLTRNTTKRIGGKNKERFYRDLKSIYTAPTEDAALDALQAVREKWGENGAQFETCLKVWEEKWPDLSVFFGFTNEVRRMIYTTNYVESLHSQLRRKTRSTSWFSSDEKLRLALYAAQRDITRKWKDSPIKHWGEIYAQLTNMYPDRVKWC